MIEKFERKINEIKKNINKKYVSVGIFFVFGIVTIFSLEMSKNYKNQKQQVQDEYNKSMYEAVSYINNIEIELAKLQITNTKRITATTLASIWKQANMAKENFENLPTEQGSLQEACKYLSQVSDYSYSLMKNVVSDDKITQKQYSEIGDMYNKCISLNNVMLKIYEDLNNGRIKWDELKKDSDNKLKNIDISQAVSNFDGINKTFQDYEGLIYDGAFSDHLLNSIPKSLNDREVSVQEAKEYIQRIFGIDNIEYIKENGESNGKIDLYNFILKLNGNDMIRNISITKKDCKMYLMISDRKVEKETLDMNIAKDKAKEFLEKLGITNIEDTYYLKTENMAIINYAAVQDGVILYPDLIKVKVALDNGEICSFESQGYIFNNTKRENLNPKITMEQAQNIINKNIEIKSKRLAIIPTDSKEEILTYEFKGKINEKEFLVYVNANTAVEEKVFIILETPGGTLTI